MVRKQNIFADMEDALGEEGGFMALALGIAFFFFLWAWIYFETFTGALLFTLVFGTTISGVITLFIAIASSVMAHREGDTP
jgi:cellulose synthase/poly-beta-1,6-N-acetylglucosamine synthase-like glycosyltransferase